MPQAVAAPSPRVLTDNASDTVRGILLAVLANLIWTLGDATAKWTIPTAGVAGAMLWRGVFGMATVLAVTVRRPGEGWRRLVPVRWGLVLAVSGLLASPWQDRCCALMVRHGWRAGGNRAGWSDKERS